MIIDGFYLRAIYFTELLYIHRNLRKCHLLNDIIVLKLCRYDTNTQIMRKFWNFNGQTF